MAMKLIKYEAAIAAVAKVEHIDEVLRELFLRGKPRKGWLGWGNEACP